MQAAGDGAAAGAPGAARAEPSSIVGSGLEGGSGSDGSESDGSGLDGSGLGDEPPRGELGEESGSDLLDGSGLSGSGVGAGQLERGGSACSG